MRIAFTPLIVLAAFIIGLAIPAQARQACTQDEANKAEQSADNLTEWSQVYDSFRRYRHCDDGSIAEGYDNSIVGLPVTRWDSVGELSKLSAAHPAFGKFVLAHINTLMSPDQAKAIAKNANQDCPVEAKTICLELEGKAEYDRGFPVAGHDEYEEGR
jgi:hypothetical protein